MASAAVPREYTVDSSPCIGAVIIRNTMPAIGLHRSPLVCFPQWRDRILRLLMLGRHLHRHPQHRFALHRCAPTHRIVRHHHLHREPPVPAVRALPATHHLVVQHVVCDRRADRSAAAAWANHGQHGAADPVKWISENGWRWRSRQKSSFRSKPTADACNSIRSSAPSQPSFSASAAISKKCSRRQSMRLHAWNLS